MRTFIALALVVSSITLAQTEAPKPSPQKVQKVTFGEGDIIDGKTEGPDIGYIHGKNRAVFKPLIKVRSNFDDKLRNSVYEL